jgi:hypothetical protein
MRVLLPMSMADSGPPWRMLQRTAVNFSSPTDGNELAASPGA